MFIGIPLTIIGILLIAAHVLTPHKPDRLKTPISGEVLTVQVIGGYYRLLTGINGGCEY